MQLHRGRPPCLAAQDGAGVCTACTLTRVLSNAASAPCIPHCTYYLAPTLHRPCTDLAPTLHLPCRMLAARPPSSPRRSPLYLPCISPVSPVYLPSSRRRAAPPWARCSTSAPTRRAPSWRARPRSRRAPRAPAPPPPAPLPPWLPRSPRRTACALRRGGGRPPRRRRRRGAQKSRRRALRGGRPRRPRHRVRWRCLSSPGGHSPEAFWPEVTWSRSRGPGTLLALTSCTEPWPVPLSQAQF